MTSKKKVGRTASAMLGIIGAMFLWSMFQQVRGFILNLEVGGLSAFSVIDYVVVFLITLALIGIGASLLYSIRKDETPFTSKNVVKLKAIAILLVVLEIYRFAAERILNSFFPIILADNTQIVVESFSGGIVITIGLVVYGIALVFNYGISLQHQVDETL